MNVSKLQATIQQENILQRKYERIRFICKLTINYIDMFSWSFKSFKYYAMLNLYKEINKPNINHKLVSKIIKQYGN